MTAPTTARVEAFISKHALDAELIATPAGVPTVETAAAALGVSPEQILKTLVFIGPMDEVVIAIACGPGRVDRQKLAGASGLSNVKIASPAFVFAATGYLAGGVAPVDLPKDAIVVVDTEVLQQEQLFGGSGTELHMLRIHANDIVVLNEARIAPILQDKNR
jgi:prolyl-tRNA editing enzyme YbaK/EbsC (Cys-tRNA(Pro) deacylase)